MYLFINIKNSGKPKTVYRYWPVSEIYRTGGQTGTDSGMVLTSLGRSVKQRNHLEGANRIQHNLYFLNFLYFLIWCWNFSLHLFSCIFSATTDSLKSPRVVVNVKQNNALCNFFFHIWHHKKQDFCTQREDAVGLES